MILLMRKEVAKMNKREKKILEIMEIAKNVVIMEDIKLLKELAKY